MATQIKTRILNKYDLLANYSTFTPLKGEICIAEVTSTTSSFDGTKPAPIVGIKVGDGTHTFAELPWIQAVAGDVVKEIKELTGVADIDAKIAALTSNRKLATVAELNALSEELGDVEAVINHAEHGNTALKSAIDTLSSNTATNLGTKVDKSVAEDATSADKLVKKSTVTADIDAAKSELNTAIGNVQTNLNTLAGEGNTATVKGNAEAITGINTKIGSDAIGDKSITKAIADLQASVGDSNEGLGSQVADLKTRMGEAETAIGTKAAQADLEALQGRVTTAEGKITTLEGEMDVVQAATAGYDASNTISAAIQGVNEIATGAQTKANANEGKINALVGDDTNKTVRAIAAEETAKIVAGADENYDTLKEIADWIMSDTTGAAEMANDITDIQTTLGITDGAALPKTVDQRISDAITEANLGQYATAEALTGVANRVTAVEGTAGDASSVNSIPGAKKYAEEQASAAQSAAEATAAADATSKANAAQAAAEATAAADATSKANAAQAAAEAKVTELANGAVNDNAEAIGTINTTLSAMNVTDTINGVVTKVDQTNGKIAVTHKKITMDEFDPDATFIFYCGTATDVV